MRTWRPSSSTPADYVHQFGAYAGQRFRPPLHPLQLRTRSSPQRINPATLSSFDSTSARRTPRRRAFPPSPWAAAMSDSPRLQHQRTSAPYRPGLAGRRLHLQGHRPPHLQVRLRRPPLQRLQSLRRQKQRRVRLQRTRAHSPPATAPGLPAGRPRSYSQGTGAKFSAEAFLNYVFAQDSGR